MNKRGQGISINVIIVAAIALIVLVVLWAIFTGRMGGFTTGVKGTQDCKAACGSAGYDGGTSQAETCSDPIKQLEGTWGDAGNRYCCCT
jgi:hypothetical protein